MEMWKRLVFCCWAILLAVSSGGMVHADEPVQAFLNELRAQGYYDEALVYLSDMETSPVAPASFKEIVTYERAKTLLASLSQVREKARQQTILDTAQANLDRFINDHRTHPLYREATELFANLLIKRSELNQEAAEAEAPESARRMTLLTESRDQLEKAREIFEGVRKDLADRLSRIDTKTTDPQLKAMMQDYRVRYMQVRLNLPQSLLLLAKTYPEGSAESLDYASRASEEFEEVRTVYSAFRGTVMLAALGVAEAELLRGDSESALSSLASIWELPQTAELRQLKRRGLEIALQCWDGQDPFPYETVIPLMEEVVGKLLPTEATDTAWLSLQLELAKHYRGLAGELGAKSDLTPEERQQLKASEDRSEELARGLTKSNNPLKSEAQQLLAEWGLAKPPKAAEVKEPENFLQARDQAVAALTDYDNARVAVETLEGAIASATDATERAELTEQLQESQEVLNAAPAKAMELFELALSMADAETAMDDLAIIRRYMAYIYLVEERYYQAGVIGSYQLETAPTAAGSQASAAIALNAYWALFNSLSAESDRSFEASRIRDVADATLKYYPESDEAIRAASIMFYLSLIEKDRSAAMDYLDKIPQESPQRYRAELSLATQNWAAYLSEKSELSGELRAEEITEEEYQRRVGLLEPLLEETQLLLEVNVPRLTVDDMEPSMVNASLAYVQLLLIREDSEGAVEVLESGEAGLLNLIKAQHASMTAPETLSQIYRAALRAYVGSLGTASDPAGRVQAARGIMQALESTSGEDAASRDGLVALYVDLLADLKEAIATTRDPQQRRALASGVGAFLSEVFGASKDPKVLAWGAKTAVQVGQVLSQGESLDEAKGILDRAETTLEALANADDESEQRWSMLADLALLKRLQGKYGESIDLYAEVLAANPALVSVQVQAAETYHHWARATRSKERFADAMTGGMPMSEGGGGDNAIWGWMKIAKVTAPSEPFRETFLRACFNQAYARLEYGVLTESERAKEMAKSDVMATSRVVADFGGEVWRSRFEALYKAIQKSLGEAETGLPEVDG